MPLQVELKESQPLTKTLILRGRLDNTTAPDLEQELDRALAMPSKVLVFDLAGLEYISSAGLRCLYRAQKSMKGRAGRVLVVNPQPPVQKVFDIVKAVDVSDVFRSVAELDAYLDTMQKQVSQD